MEQTGRSIVLALSLVFAFTSCSRPRLSRAPERISSRAPAEAEAEESLEPAEGSEEAAPKAKDLPETSEADADGTPTSQLDDKAISRRALVLRAVGTVALFPRASERASAAAMEYFDAKREKIVADLKKEGLWESASRNEKALLSAPVGTKPKSAGKSIEPGDASESLLIMLWALEHAKKLPEFDTPSPGIIILSTALPEPGSPMAEFVSGARLRPRGEIELAKEKAEFWNGRVQAGNCIADGKLPQGKDLDLLVQDLDEKARVAGFRLGPIRDGQTFFEELIRFSAFYAAKRGLILKPIRDDFPVQGKSFAELSDVEVKRISSIVASRLHALTWVLGERGNWDSFPEKG